MTIAVAVGAPAFIAALTDRAFAGDYSRHNRVRLGIARNFSPQAGVACRWHPSLGMIPYLFIESASFLLLGLCALALLAVLLVSVAKERVFDEPIRGLVPFASIIAALCALIALSAAYLRYQNATWIMRHLDVVGCEVRLTEDATI